MGNEHRVSITANKTSNLPWEGFHNPVLATIATLQSECVFNI